MRTGRRIPLNIVLLPALAQSHAGDPLFFLAGGPGQAAAKLATTLADTLRPIQRRRDIVFVDQRGTGRSNALDCKAGGEASGLLGAIDTPAATLAARMRECLQRYADRADVTKYTTRIAMDDLDDVRAVLGYSKIDLYGVSYGTRAAIIYASRHGEHLRAAILDGAMPPGMAFPLYMARDAQRAMDLLFRDCARQPACAHRFPDLPSRLAQLLDGLGSHPRETRLYDPETGLEQHGKIGRQQVAAALFASLYSTTTSTLVPLLIEQAEHDNFAGILAMDASYRDAASTVAKGMEYSVFCSEDAPLIGPEALDPASAGTFLGVDAARSFLSPCGFWPTAKIDAAADDLRVASVPALVLSGELDPVTPPSWGDAAAALPWKSSRHIVFPASSHAQITSEAASSGCVVNLVAAFLDAGESSALDASCARTLVRPPFFLTPSGPASAR